MPIDRSRLLSDARASGKKRVAALGSSLFAIVHQAMPEIERLRAEGVRWREIAEALAQQGVTQGVGAAKRSLTASRLTAIVHKLQKAEQRRGEKLAGRLKRSDLPNRGSKTAASVKGHGSSEPVGQAGRARSVSGIVPEDATTIRRQRLAAVRAFTRGGREE